MDSVPGQFKSLQSGGETFACVSAKQYSRKISVATVSYALNGRGREMKLPKATSHHRARARRRLYGSLQEHGTATLPAIRTNPGAPTRLVGRVATPAITGDRRPGETRFSKNSGKSGIDFPKLNGFSHFCHGYFSRPCHTSMSAFASSSLPSGSSPPRSP
jgi:hypothetical protein